MATETVYRLTLPRVDGGENHYAYADEERAIQAMVRRLGWGVHTGATLAKCEREVGSWSEDVVLETRRFDRTGREVRQ